MEDRYKDIPEAKCLLDHTEERIKKKKGIIMIFTGATGEGKSYAGLRLLELWYKRRFDEDFPINHVCNTLEEAILLVKDFKRKGEGILIEELSVHAGVRESLTASNVLFNKFVDICRVKQAVIIGNCPHISFIDKHLQMMCQSWVNCTSVDFKRKVVIAHPLFLQTSPHKNEPYRHRYIADDGEEIDECFFRLANPELLKQYDSLKDSSNETIFQEIILKLRHDRLKKLKKLGQKVLSPREMEAYKLFMDGCSSKEGAKMMELKNYNTFDNYVQLAKKKLERPEYGVFAKEMGLFEEIREK